MVTDEMSAAEEYVRPDELGDGHIQALPRSGSRLWLPCRPASLCAVGSALEASRVVSDVEARL